MGASVALRSMLLHYPSWLTTCSLKSSIRYRSIGVDRNVYPKYIYLREIRQILQSAPTLFYAQIAGCSAFEKKTSDFLAQFEKIVIFFNFL